MNISVLKSRLNVAIDLWLIAGWFGLACGLLEALQYQFFASLKGQIPWELRWLGTSVEMFWIAPVLNICLFILVVTPLGLISPLIQRKNLQLVAIFVLAWISFYDLLSLTGQLHYIAVLVLSTGMTLTVFRWLREREFESGLMRKGLLYIPGLVLMLAATTTLGVNLLERVRIHELPSAKADTPNVLLIVLDTLRADHLSAYGYPRPTSPNLERFAQQGVLFEQAIANSSWTVPSHASLMTGKYLSTHGADMDMPLDDSLPTLSEELARHGYVTGGFVANTYWAGRRSGFARGFIHFEDYFGSVADMGARTGYGRKIVKHVLPRLGYNNLPGRKSAADINNAFIEWVKDNPGRPFFGFLNYMDVHDPYLPPPEYKKAFWPNSEEGRSVNFLHNKFFVSKTLSPAETQMVVDAYDSSLAYLDSQLGSLLTALDKLGLSENTLVIVTSDHGESFGTHGFFAHGNSLYLEQIQVPLIMRYGRKIPEKLRVSGPVGLHSVAATVMDLLELKVSPLSGMSLMSLIRSDFKKTPQPAVLSEISRNKNAPESWPNHNGWLKSLVTSEWHLIIHEGGRVELYNLHNDPTETSNLGDMPTYKLVVEDLTRRLEQVVPLEPQVSSSKQTGKNTHSTN